MVRVNNLNGISTNIFYASRRQTSHVPESKDKKRKDENEYVDVFEFGVVCDVTSWHSFGKILFSFHFASCKW